MTNKNQLLGTALIALEQKRNAKHSIESLDNYCDEKSILVSSTCSNKFFQVKLV